MPPRRPPVNPAKAAPAGVRAPRAGRRWQLYGTVGDFTPDLIPSKLATTVVTKQERDAGLTRLDRLEQFRAGRVERDQVAAPDAGPVRPGGDRGRVERP